MKTRNGKIARLPKEIREQLNRRLENGETGKELAAWLNGLPEVKRIMVQRFGGHLVNEQNMSQWKQGGYQDWLWQQEDRSQVRRILAESGDLREAQGNADIADNLGIYVAVELTEAAQRLDQIKDPQKRWKHFRAMAGELSRLRKDNYRSHRPS
jgi:hypothetical protein